MTQYLRIAAVAAVVVITASPVARAQEPGTKPAPGQNVSPPPPIQIEVVLSRYRADKKVSNSPHVLSVKPNAGGNRGANLRLMTSVPVIMGGDKSFQYRDIGTAIDASATGPRDDGSYEVNVTISESSLVMDAPSQPTPLTPLIRSYSSNNVVLLRDGQTKQYTAATEAVTGEVVRVEVTLRLQK